MKLREFALDDATLTSAVAAEKPWDKAATGWDAHAPEIHAWLHDSTAQMLAAAQIDPGSRVLDIAAGAGDQTLAIADRVGTQGYVLATDLSAPILALAEARIRAARYTQVDTCPLDAQALGLGGARFDAALSRLGLMFCADPLAALQSARAALRTGGRYSALVFSAAQHNPCITLTLGIACKHAGLQTLSSTGYDIYYKPGALLSLGKPGLMTQLLDAAGYVDIHVKALAAPFRLPSVQHYMAFLRSAASPLIQLLAPLPAEAQDAAWREMQQALDQYSTADGWVGPNELLLCTATAP